MKNLIWILILALFSPFCQAVELMPPPANLQAGELKLTASELKSAIPLLEARVTMGGYLERNDRLNARTLEALKRDYQLAREAAPSTEINSYKIYRPEVPLYRQSDAAVATLGQKQLDELRRTAKSVAEKSDRAYRIGTTNHLVKLRDEAEHQKLERVYKHLSSSSSEALNDTLSPLPFFLQSAAALGKLSRQELDMLIRFEREQVRLSQAGNDRDTLFAHESKANLERLERAASLK
jgi:hypothetical protein